MPHRRSRSLARWTIRHRGSCRLTVVILGAGAAVCLAACVPEDASVGPAPVSPVASGNATASAPAAQSSAAQDRYPAPQSPPSVATPAIGGSGEPPPQVPTFEPLATAAIGLDGYRDMPRNVDSRVVTLDTAPHGDVLRQMQALLDAADAETLAGRTADARGGLWMAKVGQSMAAGHMANGAEAATILRRLFGAGSQPRIEGYHVHGDAAAPCLSVVTSGWRGEVTVALPTGTGAMGPGPKEMTIPGGEQRWEICTSQADGPMWTGWWWGGYGELVSEIGEITEAHPYLVVRPAGSTTPVTSANLDVTLDVPSGWTVADGGATMLQSFNATVGHGGIPADRTKIDISRARGALDDAGAFPTATGVKIERLALGPARLAAERVESTGELGDINVIRVRLGDYVYTFNCFGDCSALASIAASIRPAEAAP